MLPEERRNAPFGPEISWPTGYSDLEYRDGDYRYLPPPSGQPYQAQPSAGPPGNQGEHPYAAFGNPEYGSDARYTSSSIDEFGYGDPGYSNLGYDGPASEDAGVAGTRTVRGFVEPGRNDFGYPQHPGQGYRDSRSIEPAYPAADVYREPWDYEQPLRYEDEEPAYPAPSGPAYDPADYNGSAYSRPGIDGPGYDLSGIIGTGDFVAFKYDEPNHDRLAYDDPRYQDGPGHNGSHYDGPRFDETRLDSLWISGGEDFRPDAGYGDDSFGGGTDFTTQDAGSYRGRGLDETRLDPAADARARLTRMDMPVYDETRIEDLRALGPAPVGMLAPPQERPLDWAEQTSLDTFDDWAEQTSLDTFGGDWAEQTSLDTFGGDWAEQTSLDTFDGRDLDERMLPAGAPAAFVRPLEEDEATAARRAAAAGQRAAAAGRRRGRSGDRKQWMALSAIAILAAGSLGVMVKYVFRGGPVHTISTPTEAGPFTRMPNLEKQMKAGQAAEGMVKSSGGKASDVVSAVYQHGSSAPGSNPQIFMFVGGKLANASPSQSLSDFIQAHPGAKAVSMGDLGGEAACAEVTTNGQAASMCLWWDNDSFGDLLSPTMSPTQLATTMNTVRPDLEHNADK